MRRRDKKANVALLMPADVSNYLTLSRAEREAAVARARTELFRIMQLTGEEHARLEMDVNAWINADEQRTKLFWRSPEQAVRQALRGQLREAMAAHGLDMERLEEN
jgi:hypothetical protein